MRGDVAHTPDGHRVVLVDIGQVVLLDNSAIRVWDVTLEPGGVQPWHLHHNPYVVLSLEASPGRMDWLDGAPPRFLDEYVGGSVYRPVSPVHRLTNIGAHRYRNRLVEFKALGEDLDAPLDVGPGARSIEGEAPGPDLDDGRRPVLQHDHTSVWTIGVEPGATVDLHLARRPHVLALIEAPVLADDPGGSVRYVEGGTTALVNESDAPQTWFVVDLAYLQPALHEDDDR